MVAIRQFHVPLLAASSKVHYFLQVRVDDRQKSCVLSPEVLQNTWSGLLSSLSFERPLWRPRAFVQNCLFCLRLGAMYMSRDAACRLAKQNMESLEGYLEDIVGCFDHKLALDQESAATCRDALA